MKPIIKYRGGKSKEIKNFQSINTTKMIGYTFIDTTFDKLGECVSKWIVIPLIGLFNRGGYVLDFSTSGFDDFTQDIVGIRLTGYYGLSKGKSLAAFAEEGKENDIIKLIVALFDYYVSNPTYDNEKNGIAYQKYQNTIERIRLGIVAMNEFAKELEQRFSSEYMSSQISIMMKMTKENPTEAIGKAKELIESCCKTVGSSITLVEFLWCTHERTKNDTKF